MRNQTVVTEFIFMGFPGSHGLHIFLFILFLLIYLITIVSNFVMTVVICVDLHLHTRMYFFLCNLSILEAFNSSNIFPKMLVDFLSKNKRISFSACLTQSYFYFLLISVEFFLLGIMSFDRYVAICNPLRYTAIMHRQLCLQLILFCWVGSILCILFPTIIISRFPFCGANIIDHYFCDSAAIVKLACADTRFVQLLEVILALIVLPTSLLLTTVSYTYIIFTVLRISSADERQKAFSTCASHLIMVILVYGSAMFIEVSPIINPSVEMYKGVSLVSNALPPLLNPFIYTLRNEKVKQAIKDLKNRNLFS
ncbi:olfactory receptor 6J1-like [Rhinatrema bivittatum]|uniref:olfactory receptor 6J1-like n=1 Tax=Rhinatrema bivittatum TaxID=194408 RepID=UPI00112BF44E|nr:olfactory receptor 6J1-like [Rhinatrema bivittatum]